ncbi:thioesterase II family protein [Pseudomonadota bacterium]
MTISNADRFTDSVYERWVYVVKHVPRPAYRLYCFPFAGGSNVTYNNWVDYFPDDVELRTISLPGRGARANEPLSHNLREMSYLIADAIQVLEGGRFAFYGHSMGSILAYEVACRLWERGLRLPSRMFVSGRSAPHIRNRHQLPISKMSDQLFEFRVRSLNGIPNEISSQPYIMDYFMSILRADFIAIDQWEFTYNPPLPISITALMGLDDPMTNEVSMRAWRENTCGDFCFRSFPGDHFFIKTYEREVAESISWSLE